MNDTNMMQYLFFIKGRLDRLLKKPGPLTELSWGVYNELAYLNGWFGLGFKVHG